MFYRFDQKLGTTGNMSEIDVCAGTYIFLENPYTL